MLTGLLRAPIDAAMLVLVVVVMAAQPSFLIEAMRQGRS
jgi:hypothetical protein